MLDEGRMKYLWTDTCEMFYDHLQRIDDVEWRKFDTGMGSVYITYIDGCPTAYFPVAANKETGAERLVLNDLMDALKERSKEMKTLTWTEKERWMFPQKGYISWENFDQDVCGCGPDQECEGCKDDHQNKSNYGI